MLSLSATQCFHRKQIQSSEYMHRNTCETTAETFKITSACSISWRIYIVTLSVHKQKYTFKIHVQQ